MNKICVYHFHNGTGGGVLAVIKNLLRFSTNSNIENHVIHAVNKTIIPHYIIEPVEGAASQQLFYYTSSNNFYHTCKQLAKLLPDEKAIIVAHDWLELGMSSNLGLPNPVVQIVHGNYDYYYDLAINHSKAVDAYICISSKIFYSLKDKLPSRSKDIFHSNFPVPSVEVTGRKNDSLNLIYYVGNLLDENKQFATIVEIANQLCDVSGDYFFTIAGGGMTSQEFFESWPRPMKDRVNFMGIQSNENILSILQKQDIFLLPSLAEGLPVSLVEAMKAGVVPLVTNWDGGAEEIITPGITGYYFAPGMPVEYAACIKYLQANPQVLSEVAENCILKANSLFDPFINTNRFESIYQIAAQNIKNKVPVKVYGSRLDQPLFPNFLTQLLRNKK